MPRSDFRGFARALDASRADHDPLLDLVVDAPVVLLGEGSHGTHEFYDERAEITKRLITEKGFGARDSALLAKPRLERAIGVIYRPETERVSHYFRADMPRQFDGVYHFDETRALEPLEKPERWHDVEPPETYPTGI